MAGSRKTSKVRDPVETVVRRTRAAMAAERALRAFWPLGALLAAAWAALAFGLAEAAARGPLLATLALAGAGALALAAVGVRRFRWPRLDEARARIDAGLPGRPLAALADRPALGADDPGAASVWAAHMSRMRGLAARARPAPPDLRLARFDPLALRLMALVGLVAALVFARGDPMADLGAAIAPGGAAAVAAGPSFEAWAEPPSYTGRPTLYLPEIPAEPAVTVPEGTVVTVRVYGDAARFALRQSVSDADDGGLAAAAEGIAAARFAVERSGSVGLTEGGDPLGSWSFVMLPDAPPEIDLAEPVGRAATGETQISYVASDDHGVTTARAEVTLDLAAVDRRHGLAAEPAPRPPLAIDLPLPAARGPDGEIAETLVEDFSKHPWAGLPVTITLSAEDAIGQIGRREGVTATLPGRRFYDPIAAALVEQRRDLLWTPANADRVAQVLRAITHRPESSFESGRAYLAVRIAIRRLAAAADRADSAAQIDEVAEMLWRAALLLEEGSLGDAAERLARAQQRLQEALRGDATDEEIAQLMDELRQATRDYMRQLAEKALRDGERQQAEGPPPGQSMSQDQIRELMDRIQELSEQGRRAEAEALLEMLRQLLENMEMRLAEGGEGQQGEGGQSMEDLGDALREQQDLADDSFQELQRMFREGRGAQEGETGPGSPGEAPGEQGEGDGPLGSEMSLADRQEALRRLMEELQGALPGTAGEEAREALRRSERDMGAAEGDLREGDTAGALDRQSDAIENLREGMRRMAQDMREAETGSRDGEAAAEGDAFSQGRNDPLGRPLGAEGNVGTNERMVPEADAAARARGLLDELRRRSGDQARPQLELDYLRRLLERF
jgi:uncharacterized protein (TIGR02302 family)